MDLNIALKVGKPIWTGSEKLIGFFAIIKLETKAKGVCHTEKRIKLFWIFIRFCRNAVEVWKGNHIMK